MELLKLNEVKTISCIGGGPIGGGWTAFFLSKGFNVVSYLHDKNEKDVFMKIVNKCMFIQIKFNLNIIP